MIKLIVICGATATGKSGLALSLAERLGSVILSADSRQVYREFDIGTAKPTREEQKLIPHYLIDICEPTETMTVADYQEQTQQLIDKQIGLAMDDLNKKIADATGMSIDLRRRKT